MKKVRSLNKNKGFTLIEVLGVIFVLVLLGFGAKAAVDKMRSAGNLAALKDQIDLIIENADKVNPRSARYDSPNSISVQAMNDRNLVPEEWGDGIGANVYGGDFVLAPSGLTRYTLEVTGLPNDEEGIQLIDEYTNVSLTTPTYATNKLTMTFGVR